VNEAISGQASSGYCAECIEPRAPGQRYCCSQTMEASSYFIRGTVHGGPIQSDCTWEGSEPYTKTPSF
jgi:hypothetical protein